jgi:extracellular factor (EF) 3-hydroxypalmitic acid methyl ester biosynthesis protein
VTSNIPHYQSLVTFRNSQGEAARGTLLKLDRNTIVFEVYNPYSIVQLSEVLTDLIIRRGADPIYQGRAVVSNLVNTGLMLIVSASFADPWVQASPRFEGKVDSFRREAESFLTQWELINHIQDPYRVAVAALRSYLSELNQWLQRIEAENEELVAQVFSTYDRLLDFAGPLVERILALHETFEQVAESVGARELLVHKSFAQRELHPLLLAAPYAYRTFTKPLGYAGDYEMMNMTHREAPEGASAYAKLVNAAYIRLPIAQCVRNRVRSLQDYLDAGVALTARAGRPYRAMSIGCGPAVEVQRFIRSNSLAGQTQFRLLDFNAETLDYARSMIESAARDTGRQPKVSYVHDSVHSLLKSATAMSRNDLSGHFDFVYCAGLFDYLSDRVCARLLRLFFSWLVPGGTLLATNMHECARDRYVLEHLADWYLIYRNEEQMMELIPGLGLQRTFTDETGINLCLEVRNDLDLRSAARH